jgi:hypothetical protein
MYSIAEMNNRILSMTSQDDSSCESFIANYISTFDENTKEIPECLNGITNIDNNAFAYCINLALTSLPEGITHIGHLAFIYCINLALTSLPNGITHIGNGAFAYCTNLTTLTFKGVPTQIYSNAFEGCTNLTTINVPWAEGAVANAPWGATNATINYNYTGG